MDRRAPGFGRADAVACICVVGIGAAIVLSSRPSWAAGGGLLSPFKIANFGKVAAMYQADNRGYLPVVPTYKRGFTKTSTSGALSGCAGWSAGGKNNNAWWRTHYSDLFDIEAVDRPLTQYLMPGFFSAPPPPAELAVDSPERLRQADIWRDAGDHWTHQRSNTAARDTSITCYDDVGTSYIWSVWWFVQVQHATSWPFLQAFDEGTRRISVGQGFTPSRFAWYSDQHLSAILIHDNPAFQLTNPYGDINMAPLLFMDGHAGYATIIPGNLKASYSNAAYSLIFDDLPNPGH